MHRNSKICIAWFFVILVLGLGAWFLLTMRMNGPSLHQQYTPGNSSSNGTAPHS